MIYPICFAISIIRKKNYNLIFELYFYVICIHTGASCTLSIKSWLFVICGSTEKQIKALELTNHSSDPTLFKFETDLSPHPFSVEPAAGKVPPNSKLQITLSFCPKDQRLYFKRIFCLIKYQVHLKKLNLLLILSKLKLILLKSAIIII